MVAVYLTTITGLSFEKLTEKSGELRGKLFSSTLVFVFSFMLVFSAMGLAAGYAGSLLEQYSWILGILGGIIFIIAGLRFTGIFSAFSLSHPSVDWFGKHAKLERFREEDGGLSYPGIFLVGFFFAVFCSHCFGPAFYASLGLAAGSASALDGFEVMVAYSLGLATHYKAISLATGALMIIFGIILLTGNFFALRTLFGKIIPWKIPGMDM